VSPQDDLQILEFKTQTEWEEWLGKNYSQELGVWLRFYKKASGIESINYDQALEEALCYGWIDGQARSLDEKSYLQKFTPRRKRSMWSKTNIDHVERLKKLGKMREPGLAAFEAAKADGRLDDAYDSSTNMQMPEDFLKELSKNKKAEKFFQSLNRANTYAIAWRLQTAKKEETRARRMKQFLEMMAKEEKLH
jgi:uncharacterized protein YdeI (YjbR/CyaY-like superfamily)